MVLRHSYRMKCITNAHVTGCRCRVVVICACTDHPAMCKVGGFTDKSHLEVPCTAGTVTTADMYTDACLCGGMSFFACYICM